MDSTQFVLRLGKVFGGDHKYTEDMALAIAHKFKNYDSASLGAIYNLILENHESTWGPPPLGAILRLIRDHNQTVLTDKRIRPMQNQKAIPENTEEYMDREEMSKKLKEALEFLTTGNRKVRRNNDCKS